MNKLSILLFLFIITLKGYCQNDAENIYLKGYIESSDFFEQKVSIIDNSRQYPIIEVEIEGRKHLFLFDTGNMMTIISDKIIDVDKLKHEKTIHVSEGTSTDNEKKGEDAPITVGNITINGVSFNKISMAVLDLEPINKLLCSRIDGVLGMNLIKLCNWKINTFEKELSFSNRVFQNPEKVDNIKLTYYQGLLPLVEVNYEKTKFAALLDTGFDGTLQLFTDFKKSRKMKSRKGQGYYGSSISQLKKGEVEEILLDRVFLDNYELENVPANILNEKPLIGMGIFKEYTTILNFTENNMALVTENKKPNFTKSDDLGAKYCLNENQQLQVCFIWNDSKLKDNGIKIGDQVSAINDKHFDQLTNDQYCNFSKILKEDATIILTFKTERGEEIIEFKK